MSVTVPQAALDAAAQARCTCTKDRLTYAKTHAGYCARVAAPAAVRAILEAAAPVIVAAERERIAQLADAYDAVYPVDREDTYGGEYQVGVRFAELLREEDAS